MTDTKTLKRKADNVADVKLIGHMHFRCTDEGLTRLLETVKEQAKSHPVLLADATFDGDLTTLFAPTGIMTTLPSLVWNDINGCPATIKDGEEEPLPDPAYVRVSHNIYLIPADVKLATYETPYHRAIHAGDGYKSMIAGTFRRHLLAQARLVKAPIIYLVIGGEGLADIVRQTLASSCDQLLLVTEDTTKSKEALARWRQHLLPNWEKAHLEQVRIHYKMEQTTFRKLYTLPKKFPECREE